jgi:hypothetical protein
LARIAFALVGDNSAFKTAENAKKTRHQAPWGRVERDGNHTVVA